MKKYKIRINCGCYDDVELTIRIIELNSTMDIDSFKSFWKSKGINVEVKLPHNFLDMDIQRKHHHKYCRKLWNDLSISWNGDVYLCCMDYNGEHKLGNVTQQSIASIWTTNHLNNIRKRHLAGKGNEVSPCDRCDVI